jgi:hypothetical protein
VLFPRDVRRAPLSAFIEGFSLHAATRVMASDRRGLWRLCAYGARRAADAQGNSLDLWQSSLHYIVDDESHRLDVRAAENDAADARNARVLPIVVDLARPSSLIVWWSALDIR